MSPRLEGGAGRLGGEGGRSSTCSVGEEYAEFTNITTLPNGDWRMSLERGLNRSYAAGTRVRCYVKGNVYFLPDAMSDLYEEVAIRYANFSNLIGFQDGSFDGAGWFGWYGRCTWPLPCCCGQTRGHPRPMSATAALPCVPRCV